MSRSCRGSCDLANESQLRLGYKNGQKYCKVCQMYFLTDKIRCFCCNSQLRSKKKHNKIQRFLLTQNDTYDTMEIIGASVKIHPNQKEWLKENHINLSSFVRAKLNEAMGVKC